MRLTNFSDYALRLLIICASRAPDLVTVAEAADAYGISRNHLMKVANQLTRAGFLKAVRGRSGGLCLARPAKDISIGEVIRLTEANAQLVECFGPGKHGCVIAPACGLKPVLADALDVFLRRLDESSLADVSRQRGKLQQLLATG